MCGAFERGVGIAGKGDGAGTAAAGFGESGDGEGGASAGGDADYDVILRGLAAGHFLASGFGIVFADFRGGGQGFVASGDDEVDAIRVGGREGLDGVEGGDAGAGAGAAVDEVPPVAKSGGELFDGAGDLREGTGYGEGDGGVFSVDEGGDFEGGFAVEVLGGSVELFGAEAAESGRVRFQSWPFRMLRQVHCNRCRVAESTCGKEPGSQRTRRNAAEIAESFSVLRLHSGLRLRRRGTGGGFFLLRHWNSRARCGWLGE